VNTNSLNTKINSEILAISEAIGEKTCTFAFSIAAFLSGFLIGYIKYLLNILKGMETCFSNYFSITNFGHNNSLHWHICIMETIIYH
jgi:hypothetical protein